MTDLADKKCIPCEGGIPSFDTNENQKNPERIATSKGQNLQNLENTKKRNEEIERELIEAEKKLVLIHTT